MLAAAAAADVARARAHRLSNTVLIENNTENNDENDKNDDKDDDDDVSAAEVTAVQAELSSSDTSASSSASCHSGKRRRSSLQPGHRRVSLAATVVASEESNFSIVSKIETVY